MSDSEKMNFVRSMYESRNAQDRYATSRDYNIHELEIESMVKFMPNKGRVLDLGCGNGYTLISIAKQRKTCEYTGVDFSESFIDAAKAFADQLDPAVDIDFLNGNVIDYVNSQDDASFDVVITERLLQNLPSLDVQYELVRQIHRILKPEGRYLCCEGGTEGFTNLNKLREKLGLATIKATSTENVSSLRIREKELEQRAGKIGFSMHDKLGYSQYFIMSRVLHPLLVAPAPPRFDSGINDIARMIQSALNFSPGIGSNTLWIFQKQYTKN